MKPTDRIKVVGPASDDVEVLGDALDEACGAELEEEVRREVLAGIEERERLLLVPTDVEIVEEAMVPASVAQRLLDRLENLESRLGSSATAPALEVRLPGEEHFEDLVARLPGLYKGRQREAVLNILRRQVTTAQGRPSAPMLATAITRQLDYAGLDAELRAGDGVQETDVTAARAELMKELAGRCALQLERAAEALRQYGEAGAAFAQEKAASDIRRSRKERPNLEQQRVMPQLRQARERARKNVGDLLLNAWLAAAGAEVREAR